MTLAGVGVNAMMGKLQDNITAVDVSDQLGDTPGGTDEAIAVDEAGNNEPLTVLLMGSDSRAGKDNRGYGSASELRGARSDTTIVLHVSADRKSAIAVSIPRDTLITLPQCKSDGKTVGGYEGKFNAAFDIAGPGCTIKAVEEMTGLNINNFMII